MYVCPMKCEGEKNYQESRECPVCGLHMVRIVEFGVPKREQDEELAAYSKMKGKLILSTILTVIIIFLEMGEFIPSLNELFTKVISRNTSLIMQMVLSLPVVFYTAGFVYKKGFRSIMSWNLNIYTLIAVGTGVAWLFSVASVLFYDAFAGSEHLVHKLVDAYFGHATFILTLAIVRETIELLAYVETAGDIKELINLIPDTAHIVIDDRVLEVALGDVIVGDKIRVRNGDKIPVDGKLIEGSGTVNESMITGEVEPVEKSEGENLIAGTVNISGEYTMVAEKVGNDILLAKMIEMVNKAAHSKAHIQETVDVIAKYFVQIVIFIALLTFMAWTIMDNNWEQGLISAISVIIVSCPYALVLAVPLSIMIGIEKGAKSGIVFKSARSIEAIERITALIVDKTRILMIGKPKINLFKSFSKYSDEEVLQFAASIDQRSEHPLAKAILKMAKERNMEILRSSNFETIPGMGTIALIDGKVSAIGSKKMIEHFYVRDTYDKCYVENLEFRGQTVMFVIIDDCIVGIVCTTDRIKETTPKALVKLHQLHVKVFMLTGDNRQVASAVSNELKLDGFEAEYLPEDKLNKVKALQQEGYTVGMAGHTIADVKAIEEADVCIAMGTKNDVIVKSADAVLLEDDLLELERAKVLSVDIVRNIKQNLFFAFIYNFIAIPFAAFGFLNPIFADIAMVLSTVSVVLNALRLKKMNIG